MTHISLGCRFLGTTVESSSVLPLLQSLVQQLSMLGNQSPRSGLLSFDEAMLWRSFDPPSRTVLQTTVRTSVDFLFSRLEKLHGRILVCRALGYFTLANNEITEVELDDVL
ncbi:NACHT and WD repeat domain-containing protein 2-like [Dreissena polymorpha]|nr:NACHT and WD repeat domain-containing protein 2-like [Dreissena polymorpha]